MVTCGDTPLFEAETYQKLVEAHLAKDSSCTVLTCKMEDPTSYGRIVRSGDKVQRIVEEKDASEKVEQVKPITSKLKRYKNE